MQKLPREEALCIFYRVGMGFHAELQEEKDLYAWVTRWGGSSCKISEAEEEGVAGVLHAWVTGCNGRGVLHERQIASKLSGRNACTNRPLPTCPFLSQ